MKQIILKRKLGASVKLIALLLISYAISKFYILHQFEKLLDRKESINFYSDFHLLIIPLLVITLLFINILLIFNVIKEVNCILEKAFQFSLINCILYLIWLIPLIIDNGGCTKTSSFQFTFFEYIVYGSIGAIPFFIIIHLMLWLIDKIDREQSSIYSYEYI